MIKKKIDKVLNKIEWKIFIPLLAKHRQKKLKTKEFTIISNNCWGGRLYEYFGLQKQSPTVGLYFYAEDYVKFCSNLKYYLSKELTLITASESKHKVDLHRKGEDDVIVGQLEDVELVFLHYHSRDEILSKWQRRLKRIKWDNIILKFSYQNDCNDSLITEFLNIKDYKKICLVGEKDLIFDDTFYYARHIGKETVDETENFDRYLDIVKIINDRLEA